MCDARRYLEGSDSSRTGLEAHQHLTFAIIGSKDKLARTPSAVTEYPMPHIVHRDDLKPIPSTEKGWHRIDLLGKENIKLVGAEFELITLNPGEATPEHFHEDCEHYLFVLRGEGNLELDGEALPIAQNYVICIEPEEKHALRNAGEEVLEILEFLIPNRAQSSMAEDSCNN